MRPGQIQKFHVLARKPLAAIRRVTNGPESKNAAGINSSRVVLIARFS
jgi:hypothetical protein